MTSISILILVFCVGLVLVLLANDRQPAMVRVVFGVSGVLCFLVAFGGMLFLLGRV